MLHRPGPRASHSWSRARMRPCWGRARPRGRGWHGSLSQVGIALLCVAALGGEVRAEGLALVVSVGSGTIDFIDVDSATLLKSVPLEDRASLPIAIAVTPDEATAVVVGDTGYVSFLDVAEMQYLGTLALLAGPETDPLSLVPLTNEFGGVAVTPDGATALVTEGNELGQLFFIDIASRSEASASVFVEDGLLTGDDPEKIVSTTTDAAHVLDNDWLWTIDVATKTFTPCLLSDDENAIALMPDESNALIADSNNDIYLLDIANCTRGLDVSLPTVVHTGLSDVAVSPDGATALVANRSDQSVTFVQVGASGLTLGSTLPIGGATESVAFTPDGLSAVVTLLNTSEVKILDVATQTEIATVAGYEGLAPIDVVVVPEPGQPLLLVSGIAGLLVLRRRRNRRAQV